MAARPRRRPLSREEALALQQRRQHQREMEEESRELARGPIDLPFFVLVMLLLAIGLVMLDEAFNNMDDERIGGVLEFLRRLPLQILIAAPPDKIQYISPFVEETLLVMTDEKISYAERYVNGTV